MDISLSLSRTAKVELAELYDLVIIGAGPAGLTSAIYASRARLSTLVVERKVPGGLAGSTERIENYPGFPDGIAGAELGKAMQTQAEAFGAQILMAEAEIIDIESSPKKLKIKGKEVLAKTLIIATGTSPKKINVPGEAELAGRGVSYCATCDGPFFKDKEIVAVGAGNSGVQESIFLSKYVSKVTIVEFMPSIQAEKILVERFEKTAKGSFLLNHQVLAIEGTDKVTGVKVKDRTSGEEKLIPADGVFIWVGLKPQTDFVKDKLALDNWAYIKTDGNMRTSVDGVWAAGDVVSNATRQVVAACGMAATAAIDVEHYLSAHA